MISIELEHSNRKEVTRVLNNLLSDEYVLSTKTKNYHWNVAGPHFHVGERVRVSRIHKERRFRTRSHFGAQRLHRPL